MLCKGQVNGWIDGWLGGWVAGCTNDALFLNHVMSFAVSPFGVESNWIELDRMELNRVLSNWIELNRIDVSRVESNRIELNRIVLNGTRSNRVVISSEFIWTTDMFNEQTESHVLLILRVHLFHICLANERFLFTSTEIHILVTLHAHISHMCLDRSLLLLLFEWFGTLSLRSVRSAIRRGDPYLSY